MLWKTGNSRRDFLKLAGTTLFIGTHANLVNTLELTPGSVGTLITSLQLYTSAPLKEMQTFYQKLGLSISSISASKLTMQVGDTTLSFLYHPEGAPFYHFAFNIPENKILKAREWQLQRTELVTLGKHLQDPAMPNDIVHFRHWNAHSIFFFDPAGNILEYIARHDLPNAASGEFSPADMINVSEIGLIVEDVSQIAGYLKKSLEIGQYRQGSDQFTALGDENGLILLMKTGRILAGQKAKTYPLNVVIKGKTDKNLKVPDHPLNIVTKA